MRRWSRLHRDVITENADKLVVSICRNKENKEPNKKIIPGKVFQLGNCLNCECKLDDIKMSHLNCHDYSCKCGVHFMDVSEYRCACQSKQSRNIVASKCNCKVKKFNSLYCRYELDNIVSSRHFFNNCYHLNLSGFRHLKWYNLLAFNNRIHYLSLSETNLDIPNIDSGYRYYAPYDIISIKTSHDIKLQQVSDFFKENFNEDETKLFLKYGDIFGWFNIEGFRDNPIYEFLNIYVCKLYTPQKNEPHYLNLYNMATVPKGTELYDKYVKIISSSLEFIKNTIKKYALLKQWFATAEIDILDLTGMYVPSDLLNLLIGCKKIIIKSFHIDKATKKNLCKNGVEIIKVKCF